MLDSTQELLTPALVPSLENAAQLYGPIADQHGVLTSADGTSLFYRYWPAKAWNGRTAIVLHGIGFHSGPYKVIADALNEHGVDVYGLDARGHGLSQGPRGFTGSPAQVAEDVASAVKFVKQRQASAKIFLLGDSMGSNYALDYAKDNSSQLAGLVLLAPAFYVDNGQLFNLESALLSPYFLLAHRKPVIDLVGNRIDESSRDSQWVAARRADPLAYKKVSFGYLLDIQRLIFGWRRQIAPRVRTPILMIKGGEDHVVSHKDCLTFMRLSASPDKHFEVYPEVRHTTLWDPETPDILKRMREWILAH
jgi:alpha-beta hydrolase superfamily lysophospholipase